jgi:hypothetical protein
MLRFLLGGDEMRTDTCGERTWHHDFLADVDLLWWSKEAAKQDG